MTSAAGDDAQPTPDSGEDGSAITGTPSPEPRRPWLRWWMVILLVAVLVGIGWAITMDKDGEEVIGAQVAVASQWQTLPGPDDPTALRYTRCEDTGDNQFHCVYKTEGRDTYINVVWDGKTVTKRLAGGQLPSAGRSSALVAAALAKDDKARGAGDVTYSCATSAPLDPSGATLQGPTGLVCAKQGTPGLRYVKFTPAGDVEKDFLVKPDDGSSNAAPPAN